MRCWPVALSSAFMNTRATRPLPSTNGWTSAMKNIMKMARGEAVGEAEVEAHALAEVPSTSVQSTNVVPPAWLFWVLNGPGRRLGAAGQQHAVALLEQLHELVGALGRSDVGVRRIDQLVGALDVVGVVAAAASGTTPLKTMSVASLDGEARAFDVVGEVRLVKREDAQVIALVRRAGAGVGGSASRALLERREEVDAPFVERAAVAHGLRGLRAQRRVAGAEERPDDPRRAARPRLSASELGREFARSSRSRCTASGAAGGHHPGQAFLELRRA